MDENSEADREPLIEDRDGPLAEQGWHGGATFFAKSGGEPARPPAEAEESRGAGGGDAHLPASEAGAGIIPEDEGGEAADTHRPASEADTAPLQGEGDSGEPQSWPGKSFGSIPPPG